MIPFQREVVVESVLSQLDAGCIFSAREPSGELVRVKVSGSDACPVVGEVYDVAGLSGTYRDKHGRSWRQIEAQVIRRLRTSGALLRPWLERIPNIGSKRANRLLDAYRDTLPNVLADYAQLEAVARVLDPRRSAFALRIAQQLFAAMAHRSAKETTMLAEVEFLAHLESLKVTDVQAARRLWRLVGGLDAKERLFRNPYLAASLMPWTKADHIGRRLLAKECDTASVLGHPERLLGAVASSWREILKVGDTAATQERLVGLLSARGVDAKAALALGVERRAVIEAGPLFRAPGAAWLEDSVATQLRSIESAPSAVLLPAETDLDRHVYDAETATGFHLWPDQHDVVKRLLRLPLAVLQGGAGVGKTTAMKVLVTSWEFLGGNVVMGALAGKAALQLSRGASSPSRPRLAFTVARLIRMLKAEQAAQDAGRPSQPNAVDVNKKTLLLLDEASMLDTPSMHELLLLMPPGVRVLLVGDHGQLPPIGIGRVFHDLVDDGSRVASLTRVLRQASDSPIPHAAAAVRSGLVPSMPSWGGPSKGIFVARPSDSLASIHEQLMMHSDDVMVVAARRATVDQFNREAAVKRRTAESITLRLSPLATVAVGDPVVCTRNRYQDSLYNGLLGRVTSIDSEGVAHVLWDGEHVARALDAEAAADVELAYAITCHRAQGSSASSVVVVVEDSQWVTREWLYTAITRARETVVLVGDIVAIAAAVSRRTERVTGFRL